MPDQPVTPEEPEEARDEADATIQLRPDSSGYGYVAAPPPDTGGYTLPAGWSPPNQGYGYQPQGYQPPPPPNVGYGYPAPPATPPAPPPMPPGPNRPNRSTWIAVIAGAAVLALLAGGGVAYALTHGGKNACDDPASLSSECDRPQPGPAPTPDPVISETVDPAPTPDPSISVAADPDQALYLSEDDAEAQLQADSVRNGAKATALQGKWVPQVSSKCLGVGADIGPDWLPDGQPETASISIQQILAYNISMTGHFDALTLRQTQIGIDHDRGQSGLCADEILWLSVVPTTYGNANGAIAWCDDHDLPQDECYARYVARPGEESKKVERR